MSQRNNGKDSHVLGKARSGILEWKCCSPILLQSALLRMRTQLLQLPLDDLLVELPCVIPKRQSCELLICLNLVQRCSRHQQSLHCMLFGLSLYRLCNRTHADTYLPLMKCIIIVIIFIICNACIVCTQGCKTKSHSRNDFQIFSGGDQERLQKVKQSFSPPTQGGAS